ncbi:DUF5597 domain-containing protein [Paenarthrobacter sp. AB444]|uniref:DUF5597 domain-containing protein n=1 Tax=Paenarthrobacter sp. AB444 TaxID=3025681 RepID=UPI002365193D|nr:DUF5597 domain-containing protein [Paenarthrobacter sp. AB444]MDD7833890.1 beta-galactosidase [Paenarthrobacter sp. AB444]
MDGSLHIDDQPFTVLGAELHNSSSSTAALIKTAFETVNAVGANTVLAPVSWAQMEPVEGRFDFTLTSTMIAEARKRGLKLIILWFGSWKNGQSSYAPEWVKRDTTRFPRCSTLQGPLEVLSPFSDAASQADEMAFAALAEHISVEDKDGAVIMVQIENEVGLLGDGRDRSALAEERWHSVVPDAVVRSLEDFPDSPLRREWQKHGHLDSGTWPQLFGENDAAEEAFMAGAYAQYVQRLAEAGRRHLPVPYFVNAWLDAPLPHPQEEGASDSALAGGQRPGEYPSGGPVLRVTNIWRACAPSLSLLCPDVYFGNFDEICAGYGTASSGLFIPEMRRDVTGVAQMFCAIGQFRALGVSPFGVDSLDTDTDEGRILIDGYQLLGRAGQFLYGHDKERRQTGGFMLLDTEEATTLNFDDYQVSVTAHAPFGGRSQEPGYGLIIQEVPNCFVVIGRGFTAGFRANDGANAGILDVAELDESDEVISWRNGDESGAGQAVRFSSLHGEAGSPLPIPIWSKSSGVMRVRLYKY